MRALLSLFIYGFLFDASLSVVNAWLPITLLQVPVAWGVFALGLVLYAGTAFDQRLPKRLVLPAVLFLIWGVICGGFPLYFLSPSSAASALAWVQLLLALGLLLGHRRWRKNPPPTGEPAFSWRNFSLVAIPSLLAAPLLLGLGILNALAVGLETHSGGYVKLRPAGLMLEERQFTRKDRQVRLVSMMHIGQRDFYDQILASLPAKAPAVVLVEGVSDEQGLLKKHFSYAKIAALLGLTSQERSDFQKDAREAVVAKSRKSSTPPRDLEYRRADVDLSAFQPLTLQYLEAIGAILSDPTRATIARVLGAPDSPFRQPGVEEIVFADVLELRNQHLLAEIHEALDRSKVVVVPWGALHLPFIEEALKADGFQETRREERPVIRFWRRDPRP